MIIQQMKRVITNPADTHTHTYEIKLDQYIRLYMNYFWWCGCLVVVRQTVSLVRKSIKLL